MYFDSAQEAQSWLPFDSEEHLREDYSFWYPDTFAEWAYWRERALDAPAQDGTVGA